MVGIINDLLNDKTTIYLFGVVAILLILFLIIYLLSTGRKQSSYIGQGNNSQNTNNMGRRYYDPQSNQKPLVGERSPYNASSYQSPNRQQDNTAKEKDSVSPPKTDRVNSEKNGSIHQTLNDDGTITTEVFFDSMNEKLAPVPSLPKYEYLETANNGQFRKLLPSDEKCFFITWEENGIRKFEFHGNVDKALANINAIFDDVCEIEGKQNGATKIENEEPGILDSKLKVTTPAKIKLL